MALPRWVTELRQEPPAVLGKLLGLLCVLFTLLIWWLATLGEVHERFIPITVLPSPGEVFGSFTSLLERGLAASIAATMKRLFIGFGLAVIVGGALGILAGAWRPLHAYLAPLILLGRSLPLAALIGLTVAWFGIYESQKYMFIFIATAPFIFSDAAASVMAIHERYVETAQTLGASKRQLITKVLIPLALPKIYTSVRFMFGLAFGYIMLAEALNAETGLGYLILQSQRRANVEHIYLLLILLGLLAYAMDRLLAFFQRGLFPYLERA